MLGSGWNDYGLTTHHSSFQAKLQVLVSYRKCSYCNHKSSNEQEMIWNCGIVSVLRNLLQLLLCLDHEIMYTSMHKKSWKQLEENVYFRGKTFRGAMQCTRRALENGHLKDFGHYLIWKLALCFNKCCPSKLVPIDSASEPNWLKNRDKDHEHIMSISASHHALGPIQSFCDVCFDLQSAKELHCCIRLQKACWTSTAIGRSKGKLQRARKNHCAKMSSKERVLASDTWHHLIEKPLQCFASSPGLTSCKRVQVLWLPHSSLCRWL